MAIIDLLNGRTLNRNMALDHWYQRTLLLKQSFTNISILHHYREFNMIADKLSKDALILDEGKLMMKEVSDIDTNWVLHHIYNI